MFIYIYYVCLCVECLSFQAQKTAVAAGPQMFAHVSTKLVQFEVPKAIVFAAFITYFLSFFCEHTLSRVETSYQHLNMP